jgi:signal transduction histidine kinase
VKRPLDAVSAFRAARNRARVAFVVLLIFLVAQVVWWMVFQRNYIDAHVAQTAKAWQLQAEFASQAKAAILPPHLVWQNQTVVVKQSALAAFKERQERYLRMFAFEVPFFLAVMFLGLWVIWRSLQSDQELRRRQENFLMAASHEFRTPISSLKLLLETLTLRRFTPEQQLEVLNRAHLELERLHQTSERVLATARLERETQPQLQAHDLGRVVQQAVARQRLHLEQRGAVLDLHLSQPLLVNLNPEALEIVLSNLLDNAVKYSPEPQKPISITVFASAGMAVLALEDRGVGISSKETKFVFDQFYRVGSELTRASKGLGLGLYLVKALTERMNGRVRLESLPVGTRFVLSFPLLPEPALKAQNA